jgi:hypothetical protein
MYVLQISRVDLLKFLPKGGVVAEIGVAEGDFSKKILNATSPQMLHLIDPWEFQDREDYQKDANNVPQDIADSRYHDVCAKFERYVKFDVVKVHRAFSPAAAEAFPDNHFDWIFIDGLHTRDGVLSDLRGWAPKMKENGLILGHDFANHPGAQSMGFGVVEAVQEFLLESDYVMNFLTYETFPTYVLSRKSAQAGLTPFIATILRNVYAPIAIERPENMVYKQVTISFPDGNHKLLYHFG